MMTLGVAFCSICNTDESFNFIFANGISAGNLTDMGTKEKITTGKSYKQNITNKTYMELKLILLIILYFIIIMAEGA